jgi:hypothetical protein
MLDPISRGRILVQPRDLQSLQRRPPRGSLVAVLLQLDIAQLQPDGGSHDRIRLEGRQGEHDVIPFSCILFSRVKVLARPGSFSS